MISSNPKSNRMIPRAVMLGLLVCVCSASMAEERKIYKYVDEKGKAVYSQVPPTTGAKDGKIGTVPAPAYKGRGGNGTPYSPYDNPGAYSQEDLRYQHNQALRQRQQEFENARANRLAELQAECTRQRQPDCSDPAVLRYMESTQMPRVYRR